jgi:hypothetical protein
MTIVAPRPFGQTYGSVIAAVAFLALLACYACSGVTGFPLAREPR